MKKRLDYFDTAKGIGVFLVLLGHLQGEDIFCYSPYILPMCEWIFSFHMPLFFIISGMLVAYRNDLSKDMKTVAAKRFKGIMVPYYWFSFFYMTVVIAAFIKKQILIGTVWLNLWYVLSCYGMNVLWFLPALFFGELLFIFLMKKFSVKWAVVIMTAQCVIAQILAALLRKGTYDTTIKEGAHQFATMALRPFIVCSFIAIGYFGFRLIEMINSKLTGNVQAEAAVINAGATGTVAAEDADNNTGKSKRAAVIEVISGIVLMIIGFCLVWINHGVDFRSLVFKNVAAYYVCSVATSFGLILLCKHMRPFKILKFFGVNSLIFMAVHGSETVAYYATRIAMYANQYLTRARGYICYAIIVTVITLYVCIMIVLINKFVPFIAGKPFKNPFKKQAA